MGATEKIARFIVVTGYENIARDAVERAKRAVLDCLGAALAGVGEPVSQTMTSYVTKLGGPPQTSTFGAGLKVSAQDAALANGAIAHALDYSARVDIPRGDPALPLTEDELLAKYRDCARSQLRPDDIERSVSLALGLETVPDIGKLMATLGSPSREA